MRAPTLLELESPFAVEPVDAQVQPPVDEYSPGDRDPIEPASGYVPLPRRVRKEW